MASQQVTARTCLRILRKYAEGGLGQVAIALDEGLGREIAFKEIQPRHADREEARRRFVREAEITGCLEHPGIVPVYGIGQYDNGRPFYVMRFIQGGSLHDAIEAFHGAEEKGLDPGERRLAMQKLLGRFVDVCHAIGYAHSRGVLHRDLKPGNIMLGEYGETLVVDWGLAKATGRQDEISVGDEVPLVPGSSGSETETRHGSSIGTPAYMSPEQAAGNVDRLGPATDIYALGATLYTILTGRPPIDEPEIDVVLAQVISGDFRRPREVNRSVPKPLEAICLKAMANDPADRYPSTAALASDIEHYLADERITAYREGFVERAARWGRRYKTLARTAALSLVVITAISVVFAVVADKLRNRAVQAESKTREALEARTEAFNAKTEALRKEQAAREEADEVRERFISAFRSPDPEMDGRDVRVVDVLDRYVDELNQDATMSPTLRAALVSAIGRTYSALGRYQEALPLNEEALTLMQEHLEPGHGDILSATENLANACLNLGNFGRAIELYQKALDSRKTNNGPDHEDTLMVMNALANAYRAAGKLKLAVPLYEETLERIKSSGIRLDDECLLPLMTNLSAAYLDTGKLDQGVRLGEESLKRHLDVYGPENRCTLATMNILAAAYSMLGDLERAARLHEETYAGRNKVLGPQHPVTLTSMDNLAAVYSDAGKIGLALPLFEESFEIRKTILGVGHPQTISVMNELGNAYARVGKTDEAVALLEKTIDLAKEKLGPDHPHTLIYMHNLAKVYLEQNKIDQARRLFEETLELQEAKHGPDHPSTIKSKNGLAYVYANTGDLDKALPLFEETLQQRQAVLGPDHPDTFTSMNNLATIYNRMGKLHQALPLFREVLQRRTEKLGPSHPDTLNSMDSLADAYLQLEDYEKASGVYRESYRLRCQHYPDHWLTFNNAAVLGLALEKQGKYAEAEPLLIEGIQGMESRIAEIPPRYRSTVAMRIETLIGLYEAWNKPEEAWKWRRKLSSGVDEPSEPDGKMSEPD